MISSIIIFLFTVGSIVLAFFILKSCGFQPWHFELIIHRKYPAMYWLTSRCLFYVSILCLILPAFLIFLLVASQTELGKVSQYPFIAISVGLLLVRIYIQAIGIFRWISTKFALDIYFLGITSVLSIIYWTGQLLVILDLGFFNYSTLTAFFLSIEFFAVMSLIFTSSEHGTVNVERFYNRCIELFNEKLKKEELYSHPLTPKFIKDTEINQLESKYKPEKHDSEKQSQININIDIPNISMEAIDTSLFLPEEQSSSHYEEFMGAFSSVCEAKVIEIGKKTKAEIQDIIIKLQKERDPYIIKKTTLCFFFTLIMKFLYAVCFM